MRQRFLKRPKNPNRVYLKEMNVFINEELDKHMKEKHDLFVSMFRKAGCSEDKIPELMQEVRREVQVEMIKSMKAKMREKLLEQKAKISFSKK